MKLIKAALFTVSVTGVKRFSFEQYKQIYSGFRNYNLNKEQVRVYAKQHISSGRMQFCKHALAKKFPAEEMAEWLSMGLQGYVFMYVIRGRMLGIPKEKVQEYAKADLPRRESFKLYLDISEEYR